MPLTNGFNTVDDRFDHWDRHHTEFEPPPMTESDYESRADVFLGGAKGAGVLECNRTMPDGSLRTCRYDPSSNEYGVVASGGFIVTYFKPTKANPVAYFHKNC